MDHDKNKFSVYGQWLACISSPKTFSIPLLRHIVTIHELSRKLIFFQDVQLVQQMQHGRPFRFPKPSKLCSCFNPFNSILMSSKIYLVVCIVNNTFMHCTCSKFIQQQTIFCQKHFVDNNIPEGLYDIIHDFIHPNDIYTWLMVISNGPAECSQLFNK